MARPIDADALIAWIKGCQQMTSKMKCVIAKIETMPDAVSVVRCKECKHWERLNYEAPKEGWCDDQMPYSDGRWVDADDYCSYGERRDDE